MIKKILIGLLPLAFSTSVLATPLTPDEALQRVAGSGQRKAAAVSNMKLAYTQKMADGQASVYIFSPEDGKGFMLLSADDVAYPILGYSDTGRFDVDNMPPSLLWWLGEYEKQIKAVVGKEVTSNNIYAPAEWTAIPAMMTTRWNQDKPYNNDCPEIGGVIAPSGCVAVSFAQVMNYFKYPEKGQGRISYTDNYGRKRSMNFARTIDWDNMLDNYQTQTYNDDQAAAVAWLMKACGFAVEMGYTQQSSGAQSYKLCKAAVDYFKYDEGIWYTERNLYSTDEWTAMVYNNLKNVGPVIYDGSSIDGGHSFVCDGYDGNGYFHFNWGWGGSSDGYYLLDALNPESQGIGGAEGGFNYSQGIILGMQKPTGGTSHVHPLLMRIYGCLNANLNSNKLNFFTENGAINGWGNGSYKDIKVNVGAIICKADGQKVAEVKGCMSSPDGNQTFENLDLGVYNYYSTSNYNPCVILPDNLQDGTYKVYVATKAVADDGQGWQPMVTEYGNPNYIYLSVEGGQKTVQAVTPAKLVYENSEIVSPLYIRRNAKLVTTLRNDSELQLTTCFTPMLYRDGVRQYEGDYMLATVDPGETAEISKVVKFFESEGATNTGYGEYELIIMDRYSNQIVGSFGTYQMTSTSGSVSTSLVDLSVVGATQETIEIGSRTFKDVNIIADEECEVHLDFLVKQGYLDTYVNLSMSEFNPDLNKYNGMEMLYQEVPFIGKDQNFEITLPVNFAGRNRNTVYQLRATYLWSGQNKSIGSIYIGFDNSAVDCIELDESAEVEYFNLQGLRVEKPYKGQMLIRKVGGVTRKVMF